MLFLGPSLDRSTSPADWKGKQTKKRDACFGILDKDCEVKSLKCVVIHLSHFPLPSKCLQKDSDCRVHSIPLLGDDPASPSDCANWAMQAVFAS